MVAVPAATPVTVPVALTLAIDELELLHVPPVVGSVRVVIAPVQTVDAPVMVDGVAGLALTVMVEMV
jgi:hypothetical protein